MDPRYEAIRGLLPPEVALAIWLGGAVPPVYPEEGTALARAVPIRAAEFGQGRACARAALGQFGVPSGPIPVGAHRAPVWPSGFVGSITHCRGLVAAVAARSERIVALGLDAEPVGALPEGTGRLILHPMDPHDPDGREGVASIEKVVFSAKESIFKALFPLTGVWLGFLDVVVAVDEAKRRFTAAPAPGAAATTPELTRLRGSWAVADGIVVAAAHLARW